MFTRAEVSLAPPRSRLLLNFRPISSLPNRFTKSAMNLHGRRMHRQSRNVSDDVSGQQDRGHSSGRPLTASRISSGRPGRNIPRPARGYSIHSLRAYSSSHLNTRTVHGRAAVYFPFYRNLYDDLEMKILCQMEPPRNATLPAASRDPDPLRPSKNNLSKDFPSLMKLSHHTLVNWCPSPLFTWPWKGCGCGWAARPGRRS
jgi:hypothetical protein